MKNMKIFYCYSLLYLHFRLVVKQWKQNPQQQLWRQQKQLAQLRSSRSGTREKSSYRFDRTKLKQSFLRGDVQRCS